MFKKIVAVLICVCFVFEQAGFAQVAPQMQVPEYLTTLMTPDRFRPCQMRSIELEPSGAGMRMFIDRGDDHRRAVDSMSVSGLKLLRYFQIGLRLPNAMFWVNLRPDTADNIIDPMLENTDLGKVLLAADVQLKKDLAKMTSPDTAEGRQYWNRLYTKAQELYGVDQDIQVPTVTRPWIVPGEVVIRQTKTSAYIYKAGLKVMLEKDYLKSDSRYAFDDPRAAVLNEYASDLVRSLIIPKLTRKVNASRAYADLRQVYYSLVLAQWYKQHFKDERIDSKNITMFSSQRPWDKQDFYRQYRESFEKGEYNKQEQVTTEQGVFLRQYTSGGLELGSRDGGQMAWTQINAVNADRNVITRGMAEFKLNEDKMTLVSDSDLAVEAASRDGGENSQAQEKHGRIMNWAINNGFVAKNKEGVWDLSHKGLVLVSVISGAAIFGGFLSAAVLIGMGMEQILGVIAGVGSILTLTTVPLMLSGSPDSGGRDGGADLAVKEQQVMKLGRKAEFYNSLRNFFRAAPYFVTPAAFFTVLYFGANTVAGAYGVLGVAAVFIGSLLISHMFKNQRTKTWGSIDMNRDFWGLKEITSNPHVKKILEKSEDHWLNGSWVDSDDSTDAFVAMTGALMLLGTSVIIAIPLSIMGMAIVPAVVIGNLISATVAYLGVKAFNAQYSSENSGSRDGGYEAPTSIRGIANEIREAKKQDYPGLERDTDKMFRLIDEIYRENDRLNDGAWSPYFYICLRWEKIRGNLRQAVRAAKQEAKQDTRSLDDLVAEEIKKKEDEAFSNGRSMFDGLTSREENEAIVAARNRYADMHYGPYYELDNEGNIREESISRDGGSVGEQLAGIDINYSGGDPQFFAFSKAFSLNAQEEHELWYGLHTIHRHGWAGMLKSDPLGALEALIDYQKGRIENLKHDRALADYAADRGLGEHTVQRTIDALEGVKNKIILAVARDVLSRDMHNNWRAGVIDGNGEAALDQQKKLVTPRGRDSENPGWDQEKRSEIEAGKAVDRTADLSQQQREALNGGALYRTQDGAYVILMADGSIQLDTLNTPFEALSQEWKEKNSSAVEAALDYYGHLSEGFSDSQIQEALNEAIDAAGKGGERSVLGPDYAGTDVLKNRLVFVADAEHKRWMADNQWQKDENPGMFVGFSALPGSEQLKSLLSIKHFIDGRIAHTDADGTVDLSQAVGYYLSLQHGPENAELKQVLDTAIDDAKRAGERSILGAAYAGSDVIKQRVVEIGDKEHNRWMLENDWQKNDKPELFVAFNNLPGNEQYKDLISEQNLINYLIQHSGKSDSVSRDGGSATQEHVDQLAAKIKQRMNTFYDLYSPDFSRDLIETDPAAAAAATAKAVQYPEGYDPKGEAYADIEISGYQRASAFFAKIAEGPGSLDEVKAMVPDLWGAFNPESFEEATGQSTSRADRGGIDFGADHYRNGGWAWVAKEAAQKDKEERDDLYHEFYQEEEEKMWDKVGGQFGRSYFDGLTSEQEDEVKVRALNRVADKKYGPRYEIVNGRIREEDITRDGGAVYAVSTMIQNYRQEWKLHHQDDRLRYGEDLELYYPDEFSTGAGIMGANYFERWSIHKAFNRLFINEGAKYKPADGVEIEEYLKPVFRDFVRKLVSKELNRMINNSSLSCRLGQSDASVRAHIAGEIDGDIDKVVEELEYLGQFNSGAWSFGVDLNHDPMVPLIMDGSRHATEYYGAGLGNLRELLSIISSYRDSFRDAATDYIIESAFQRQELDPRASVSTRQKLEMTEVIRRLAEGNLQDYGIEHDANAPIVYLLDLLQASLSSLPFSEQTDDLIDSIKNARGFLPLGKVRMEAVAELEKYQQKYDSDSTTLELVDQLIEKLKAMDSAADRMNYEEDMARYNAMTADWKAVRGIVVSIEGESSRDGGKERKWNNLMKAAFEVLKDSRIAAGMQLDPYELSQRMELLSLSKIALLHAVAQQIPYAQAPWSARGSYSQEEYDYFLEQARDEKFQERVLNFSKGVKPLSTDNNGNIKPFEENIDMVISGQELSAVNAYAKALIEALSKGRPYGGPGGVVSGFKGIFAFVSQAGYEEMLKRMDSDEQFRFRIKQAAGAISERDARPDAYLGRDGGKEDPLGGIDFRAVPLPGVAAPGTGVPVVDMKALQALAANAKFVDADAAWKSIEKDIAKKTVPYEQLKSVVAVSCCQKDTKRLSEISARLAQILKLEEECGVQTSAQMAEVLQMLESAV